LRWRLRKVWTVISSGDSPDTVRPLTRSLTECPCAVREGLMDE
jgi:hypothetical protein